MPDIKIKDNSEDEAIRLIKTGFVKLSQRKFEVAKSFFDKASVLDFNINDVFIGKAYCSYKLGDKNKSIMLLNIIDTENLTEIGLKYYEVLFNILKGNSINLQVPLGKKYCPNCGRIVNDYDIICVNCNQYFENNYLSYYGYSVKTERVCNYAFKLFNKKEYENALRCFNKVLKEDPDDTLALIGMVMCYQNLGNPENALNLCNQVLKSSSEIINHEVFKWLLSEIINNIYDKSKMKKCPSCGELILSDSVQGICCDNHFGDETQGYYINNEQNSDYKHILNALKVGNVPQCDVLNLSVAHDEVISEFKKLLSDVLENQSYVKFLNGAYGAGKSFLFQCIGEIALKRNFVVSQISIMNNSNINLLYKDIMNSLITYEGDSFKQIIDNWLDEFQDILIDEEEDLFDQVLHEELYDSLKFSSTFISAIEYYNKFRNSGDLKKASSVISWITGDVNVQFSYNDYSKFDEFKFLQSVSYFIKLAGYSGLVILIDDADNIMAMDNELKRDFAYVSIKYVLDSCSLNNFKSSLFIFAGTPELFEHQQKGIPSYGPLEDRVKTVLNTDLEDMRKPVLNLKGFDEKNLKEIAGQLITMHEEAYGWNSSDMIYPVLDDIVSIHLTDASLVGGKVTPRIFIRSFISVLDTVQQNQSFFKEPNQIIELFEKQEIPDIDDGIDFEDIDEFDDDW